MCEHPVDSGCVHHCRIFRLLKRRQPDKTSIDRKTKRTIFSRTITNPSKQMIIHTHIYTQRNLKLTPLTEKPGVRTTQKRTNSSSSSRRRRTCEKNATIGGETPDGMLLLLCAAILTTNNTTTTTTSFTQCVCVCACALPKRESATEYNPTNKLTLGPQQGSYCKFLSDATCAFS